MENNNKEILEGYVVDIICLRKMTTSKYTEQAKKHTTECALMGHCVESGYGLIGPNNRVNLLDPQATPMVVDILKDTKRSEGVFIRVTREMDNGEMKTGEASFTEPSFSMES